MRLLPANIVKLAKSLELRKLIEAKERSDAGDYTTKNKILQDILNKSPKQFKIDSKLNEKYVGITHIPSGFKIHTQRKLIPSNIEYK
jgi:hypothetical protein